MDVKDDESLPLLPEALAPPTSDRERRLKKKHEIAELDLQIFRLLQAKARIRAELARR